MNPFRRLLDELDEILDRRDADAEDGTDEGADSLSELRAEVADHLAHDRPADEDPEKHSRIVGILEDAEDRWQAQHPRLAQAISQTLRSLSDAGL